ncbi:hypothetical protein ACK8HX_02165 [Oryzobacter sp. R7]|uniref:hypothetical protein n=1 Tax=Oryzobacter faecalis TaxID=3388656 RepID=UPI00398D394D
MTAGDTAPSPAVPMDALPSDQVVLCIDGPLRQQAFWAGDLAARQRAAARVRNEHTPLVALGSLHYRPTERDQSREIRFKRDGKPITYTARAVTYRPLEVVR